MSKLLVLFFLSLCLACEAEESSKKCDFVFDIAGGYQRIEGGETAFNTGVTFNGDICALKSDLKKITGSLYDDNKEDHKFIGIWSSRRKIFARTESGQFLIAEIINSDESMTKEELDYLNSVLLTQ